jgi:alpha-tubulin suppressor-like RCC1 family protein
MKKIALLLLLSGCFNPKLQNGVPCAENDQCPEGQICADDKRCYDPDQVPEIDASVDGPDDVLRVVELAAALHTCARFSDGTLRCFGMNAAGQLGLGMGVDPVGDNEPPNSIPLVAINGVASVGAGSNNTCVALENGDLICWGNADQGELGQGDGNFELVGDDEDVSGLAAIDLGGAARKACSSSAHMTCALLESGQVRCFGTDLAGPDGSVIGIPGVNTIGLNDRPAQFPSIDFGTTLIADFDCGSSTAACAVNENGEVFCWGVGPLGYPGVAGVGENEEPVDAGPVDVGGTVAQVAVGNEHACARLTSGAVRCWGAGAQLGYGDGQDIGDNEPPADAGDVDINGVAVEIRANGNMTCGARLRRCPLLGFPKRTRCGARRR